MQRWRRRNANVQCEKKGGGVKYKKKEILGVSDVIFSSCAKARISKMFHHSCRLYQAEQSEAGQGSFLARIYPTETFLRVNGWQECTPRD